MGTCPADFRRVDTGVPRLREGVFSCRISATFDEGARFQSHSQRFHQGHSRCPARGQGATENAHERRKQHAVQEDSRRDAEIEEHFAEGCEVSRPG